MHLITVTHTISMGHRLPSYDGICSSPHGHNVTVEVDVPCASGVFLDFKSVHQKLAQILNDFDHAMVLHEGDKLADVLQNCGFRVVTLTHEPSTENIACYVYHEMSLHFLAYRVTVHETAKYSATVDDDSHPQIVGRIR